MKKMTAALLALMMLLCAALCLADEIRWSDIEKEAPDIAAQGSFHSLPFGVKLWIPDVMTEQELTEKQTEQGWIACWTTADGSKGLLVRGFFIKDESPEAYVERLQEAGEVSALTLSNVNGIAAATYAYEKDDATCMDVFSDKGFVIELTAAPTSDRSMSAAAAVIFASFQGDEK